MNNKLIRSSNNLSIGIVGLPNIGKSTLFNLLTDSDSPVEDYPFCTINPHISLIIPQDNKLTFLTSLFDPHKSTPYTIKIHDIAGLVKGASEGLGLGNEFLENIRQVDGIIHVIKLFNTTDINLVLEDIKVIQDELRMKDIQIVNSNKKSLPVNLFKKLISLLEEGKLIYEDSFDKNDSKLIVQLNLLTVKNVIYLCNVSQETYDYITLLNLTKESKTESKNETESKKETESESRNKSESKTESESKLKFTQKIKNELNLLKQLKKYNPFIYTNTFINKEKLVERIKECLNIITYYTCGKKEVKGWTISNGTTANYAGKVIHTDFVDNFIAVDVIKYDDIIKYKLDCKKMGKLMIKGKGYVVEEGDILEFKIGTKGKKK